MSRARSLLLFAVLLPGFNISSVCQEANGTIVGRVRVQGEAPRERVLVKLQLFSTMIATTYTDNRGSFYFDGLRPGRYDILVEEEQYLPARVEAAIHPLTVSNAHVLVDLVPKPPKTPGNEGQFSGSNPNMVSAEELAKRYPKDAVREYEKGLKAAGDGKSDDAIEHFLKALEIAPDFYPARNNLGSAYLSKRDFEKARIAFQQVIAASESDSAAYFNLANVYLITNRLNEAFAAGTKGLERNPASPVGQFVMGSIYFRMGQYKLAEDALRAALAADPAQGRVRLELVNLYMAQKNLSAAQRELKLFIEQFPEDPLAKPAKQVLEKLEAQR